MNCPYCSNENCNCGSESDYFDPAEIDDYVAQLELDLMEASDGE